MSDLFKLAQSVSDEASFVAFLAAVVVDRQRAVAAEARSPSSQWGADAGGWENTSIETYLDAAKRWGGDPDGWHRDENPWSRCAQMLAAAKGYE